MMSYDMGNLGAVISNEEIKETQIQMTIYDFLKEENCTEIKEKFGGR